MTSKPNEQSYPRIREGPEWPMGAYCIGAYCENCSHSEQLLVKRGKLKPEYMTCRWCGCFTLRT